jgi:hypothetical protein
MIVVVVCSAIMALAVIMTGAWAVQLRTRQSGWIDTIWSFAVGVVGAAAALAPIAGQEGLTARQMLISVCVLAWSVRLGLHIMRRTLRGGDDPRYKALREEWAENFVFRLFLFLQVQAAAALVLVICVLAAARNTAPLGWGDALGLAIMAVAVLGEAAADAQLARFAGSPGAKGTAGVAFLSRDRGRLARRQPLRTDRAHRPRDDLLAARPCVRHSASRGAYVEVTRGGFCGLPEARQCILPRSAKCVGSPSALRPISIPTTHLQPPAT